jgi:hypothetical protein
LQHLADKRTVLLELELELELAVPLWALHALSLMKALLV